MDHHSSHHGHDAHHAHDPQPEPVSDSMEHMGGHHMDMMMMYFHGGYTEVILFDFWRINSLGGLIGSMIGCFLMGILYEGIKSYREYWMNGAFKTVSYDQVRFPHFRFIGRFRSFCDFRLSIQVQVEENLLKLRKEMPQMKAQEETTLVIR